MDDNTAFHKQRCKAMIDAGIDNPDGTEGILFCAGSRDGKIESRCPYNYCVVFEHEPVSTMRAKERKVFARRLSAHGVSSYDIALILSVSERTVMRYLHK